MKVVAIISSPKGKNSTTLRLVNAALEGAREAGTETELVDVARKKINYCKGCVSCYAKGKCVQKDEYNKVAEKFFSADGVILSSPNYIDNVSAQLKTFLDRSANSIHEQMLDGKYGLTLTTSGGSEYENVLKVMNSFINRSGGLVVGSVGFSNAQGAQGMEEGVRKAREAGKDLVAAIKEKRSYPDQEAPIKEWRRRFEQTLKFNKERWTHNYQHWVEKGWIKE